MAAENLQVASGFSSGTQAFLSKSTLAVAKKWLRFANIGDKLEKMNESGTIWKAVRYEKLSLPTVALTEGVTPDGSSMSLTTVTGTAEQWGMYVTITDVADLTVGSIVMKKATELLGIASAELVDREIQRSLQGATNVFYADATSPIANNSRDDILTADIINTLVVQTAVADLRNSGAMEYDGTNYMGVVDPSVEMDFINDTKFNAASEYSKIVNLEAGEIGQWMGVRWIRSNYVQKYTYLAAPTLADGASSGGTFTTATYYAMLVGRSKSTGFEELISASGSASATASHTCTVTATVSNDYVYDIYCGLTGAIKLTSSVGVTAAQLAASVTLLAPGSGVAAPVSPSGATTVTVHNTWIFGKGAFGVTELESISRYITPAGPSDSDPLAQRRKTGFKLFFKAIILNNDWMAKIESSSSF